MKIERIQPNSNKAWRKERSKSIGASAVPILFGENYFMTPIQLCEKMREEIAYTDEQWETLNDEQNIAMLRGHAYEDAVAKMFSFVEGKTLIKSSTDDFLIRRSDIPYMHASPDRTYWIDANGKQNESNKGILECKTTRRKIDQNEPPLAWVYQLQVQLGISGYKEGYLAWDVLSINDGFGCRRYEFDEELFKAAVEMCEWFWNECVCGDTVPECVNGADVIRRYPITESGTQQLASSELITTINELIEIKKAISELETEEEALSNKIKSSFHEEEALVDDAGNVLCTYKTQKGRNSFDSKTFAKAYPDLYTQYTHTSEPTRVLKIK
jgi:predicted phage-related endonuclease